MNLVSSSINTKNATDMNRYIEFNLSGEDYAFPLLMVREVISVPKTTPLPNTPKHFVGIMNLRGEVISIIDLRMKLKVPPKKDREEAVIIINFGDLYIGVIVDAINKVLSFSKEEVSDMPEVESQLNTSFIQGVYRKDNSLTILLDLEKVLEIEKLKEVIKSV